MRRLLLCATVFPALTFVSPAFADAETEALRAQIKLLEARLNALEKKQAHPAPAQSAHARPAAASPFGDGALESRVAVLERKEELSVEAAQAKAEKTPMVEVGRKGLSITSADKEFALKLNGYAQFDYRNFWDGPKGSDEFLARRLRPILTVQAWKDFSFRLMPDFAGSSTRIFDAHADYRYADGLQFRVGKFKPPISLERLQSASDTFFTERGQPTNLAPNRDLGAMIYGEPLPQLEYQLGVFNGNADLGNSDDDLDNRKDVVARVFVTPFKESNTLALQGLGFGVGGSHGERQGDAANPQLPQYRTPGQQSFFAYRGAAISEGDHWRLYPQAYYYYNNMGLLGEYALSSQDVTLGGSSERFLHRAWQVAGSYVLTGEDVSFKGSVKPANNFNPKANGWGAFELVGRIGETRVDKDAFPVFANPATAAERARAYGAGLNWYLNENVKLATDFDFTTFDGGAAAGADRDNEKVMISRAQFRF